MTKGPVYRCTRCDNCQKPQKDCIWVRRDESGAEYVLCGRCRRFWRETGHALTNIDPEFQDVAA